MRVVEDVAGQRLRVMAADEDRDPDLLLELLGHLRHEGVEVREAAHGDEIGLEGDGALEEGLVPVEPGEMGCLEEEVVVEAGVEDQVDRVPVVLEHRHQVADAQVLDAAVVEQDAHYV